MSGDDTRQNAMREQVLRGIVESPLGKLLEFTADDITRDEVSIRLPYRDEVTTLGDLVHGGAISALVDTAATAAAWAGVDDPAGARGSTAGFSINFLSGARGQDIIARARPLRRGGTLTIIEVDVEAADGTAVAKALVTYRLDLNAG